MRYTPEESFEKIMSSARERNLEWAIHLFHKRLYLSRPKAEAKYSDIESLKRDYIAKCEKEDARGFAFTKFGNMTITHKRINGQFISEVEFDRG
jgi:hypothetical protein